MINKIKVKDIDSKRTDFSGRTVITPDPTLSINELGVPIGIATVITFPEIVTPNNVEWLSKLVRNGRDHYPGANYVFPSSGNSEGRHPIDLRFRKEKIDLRYGDIVERHTINGDIYLLNRQPTLHKLSMMGHRAVVIDNPNYCTFRINPNVTTPYNADFDGDEMNVFPPQSIEAQIELEEIADLKLQIITPQQSSPIIAMKQDQIVGMWNLTANNFELDWRTTMNLLSGLELNSYNNILKDNKFSGKEIFSKLIPKKINLIKGELVIKNGKMEAGTIGNDSIGVKKKNSIIQLVWDEYGVEKTRQLLDNITRLATHFNLYYGMTFGIKDIYVNKKVINQFSDMIETKKLQILHEISELENNPDMINEELFEKDISNKLDVLRDDIGKLIIANSEYNNYMIFMKSGANSKVGNLRLTQIAACVGQQSFLGGRMKKNYNGRSLPYFFKNDDRPESRGFIEKSFTTGLTLPNYIFLHLAAREGLIDQTVRSVTGDTKIIIIENSKPKVVEIGSWIDSQLDNINPELIERDKNNFELLNVKKIQIPTVDNIGNTSWGEVTAITRHDPGMQLFEIVTKSGRKVIVPESKSLLIWNSLNNKFEEKLTIEVVLGDCVPVTMNLPIPPIINKFVDIAEYFYQFGETKEDVLIPDKFELNKINGQFIGLFLTDGNVNFESDYIQITKYDENTLKFIENYFDSLNIKKETVDYVKDYSKILCKFLDLMCGHEDHEKHIPEFSYTAPEEFIIGLIDGYISGNGCIDNNGCISVSSCSEKLIDGLNILLARLSIFSKKSNNNNDKREIKENYNLYEINIKAQWVYQFKLKIKTLLNENKNNKLIELKSSEQLHPKYKEQNDVILDKIVKINLIDISKYKKLYDLTVSSTNNFIIFNGIGCYDTSESGYIQRKLIKATEDMMVNYDGTVRNAVGRILQFQYGDSGADTVKQYEYNFKLMDMGNEEIKSKYGMEKEELKRVKEWSESDNLDFIKIIIKIRDNLRKTQIKSTLNYVTINTSYMLPVNLNRIKDNIINDENLKGSVHNEPMYIINMIKEILEPFNTRLYCLTNDDMKNKNSIKYRDDQVAKTAFSYALTDLFAPKKCIFQYKLSKAQLDEIKKEIIMSFNKSIVEPGEMVGIIAAQSLGEPVTQLMLNSLDWEQEIMISNKSNKEDKILPIGKFIDELIESNKNKIKNPIDNLKAEMKNIFYLDTNDMEYHIKSVDENGKVSWKHIEAVTKHLPINKDGSDTLIKVTTKTGKSVVATKGKSFLTQKDNLIVPIRGDELKVGDYLPVIIRCLNLYDNEYEIFETQYEKIYNLNDVFMDKIISIEEVKPTHTYVYDFTVADTKNFVISNGLCVRDSFHSAGVGGKGGTNIGVDRIKEILSLSKNPKEPQMAIYFDKEHRTKKDFANKIASYVKFTTIKDLRTKIEIFYESDPYASDGFIAKDNVGVPFYTYQSNKQCCSNSIDDLNWLMRIEFDKEKLLTKEVTLLDIKSLFCFAWEKRYTDIKGTKREKKQLIDKITQLAVQSNTDNDNIPVIHIRFDMTDFTQSTLVDFMDIFIDEFKLKGMPHIEDVAGGKANEERIISFDNQNQQMEKNSEYVIWTKGINMEAVKNIVGIDLNRTYCDDIITIYENFGIEAARSSIIRQITAVLDGNGSSVNYQHIQIFGDLMTQIGTLTSIDRHGLNKLDNDPLSRASFEKTVDQLITAAIFNEVDYMKSVSSRIMAGLCIKGGTGLCNLILDKELLENSEYTNDIGQLYQKTYKDITSTLQTQEIDEDVFIPEI